MFNEAKLKATLTLKQKNVADLAIAIGVNKTTLYRKISGESDFKRNDIVLIARYLDLTNEEVHEIFFDEKVS